MEYLLQVILILLSSYLLLILILTLFTLLAAVVELTRLTTQALVNSPQKPHSPSCKTGLPSDFRARGPKARGHENGLVNQSFA